MRKCFFLALLAVFLACLPGNILAQDNSPLVVDQPRLSKMVFTNWEPIEVIFTVRYLDGYEPDYERIKNLSFSPFELDPETKENPRIIREQKYKAENYFDVVYSLRLIGEKKGEIVLPAQKFFYLKLEPGKPREELEVKEFETKEIKLRYNKVITSEANDIIDRIDFGDFRWQAWFWRGLALGGFALSTLFCWAVAFRYHPVRKSKKESSSVIPGDHSSSAEPVLITAKESKKKLVEALNALEVSGEEFENLKQDSAKRRQKEADLCNALRMFLLSHVSILASADTTREMFIKISSLKRGFSKDYYFGLANLLRLCEKELYEETGFLWKSESWLKDEISSLKKEIRNLNWPAIWWKEFQYRCYSWRNSR